MPRPASALRLMAHLAITVSLLSLATPSFSGQPPAETRESAKAQELAVPEPQDPTLRFLLHRMVRKDGAALAPGILNGTYHVDASGAVMDKEGKVLPLSQWTAYSEFYRYAVPALEAAILGHEHTTQSGDPAFSRDINAVSLRARETVRDLFTNMDANPDTTSYPIQLDQAVFAETLNAAVAILKGEGINSAWLDRTSQEAMSLFKLRPTPTNTQAPVQSPQAQAAPAPDGPRNLTILSFFPNAPGGGHLGTFIRYIWSGPDRQTFQIPVLFYDAELGAERGVHFHRAYLHGTDGQFVYFTLLTRDSVQSGYHCRADISGIVTRIKDVPSGLKGGHDELDGAATTAPPAGPPISIEPLVSSRTSATQGIIPIRAGYYVSNFDPTDRWPGDDRILVRVIVRGGEVSVLMRSSKLATGHQTEFLLFHGIYSANPFHADGGLFSNVSMNITDPETFTLGPYVASYYHRLVDAVQPEEYRVR
jgi:hypothetical protein